MTPYLCILLVVVIQVHCANVTVSEQKRLNSTTTNSGNVTKSKDNKTDVASIHGKSAHISGHIHRSGKLKEQKKEEHKEATIIIGNVTKLKDNKTDVAPVHGNSTHKSGHIHRSGKVKEQKKEEHKEDSTHKSGHIHRSGKVKEQKKEEHKEGSTHTSGHRNRLAKRMEQKDEEHKEGEHTRQLQVIDLEDLKKLSGETYVLVKSKCGRDGCQTSRPSSFREFVKKMSPFKKFMSYIKKFFG